MANPDPESRRILREAWQHYNKLTQELPAPDFDNQSVNARRAIMRLVSQKRRIFLRGSLHEVVVQAPAWRYVKISFVGDKNVGRYNIDPRTLHAPSPLELLAMQAD